MIINLISGPRNISTAMMYSFAQRSDTRVVDEPLYAHYLRLTDADHPGKSAILQHMNPDGNAVVQSWQALQMDTSHLFLKNMAHHLIALDLSFLLEVANVILIRSPREVLASFSQVIRQPSLQDIGIVRQAEIYHDLVAAGQPPLVIRGNDVRKSPTKMLQTLCQSLGIPFEHEMLVWEAGARPEDGVWAPYWYHNVHQSTGFAPYVAKEIFLDDHLVSLEKEAQPYYEQLSMAAI